MIDLEDEFHGFQRFGGTMIYYLCEGFRACRKIELKPPFRILEAAKVSSAEI